MIATDRPANTPFKKGLRADDLKLCQGCDSHRGGQLTGEHVDLESVGPGDS
jgi:hypothetical protein